MVLNEESRADGNKDSHYYTGRLGVPYFTTQVYKRNFPCLSISLVVLLGLTFQPNCKFSEHVRLKLTKANKCLHILRTLRKELFSQKEIDHLFKTLVLPILTYGLAVYGASDSDLNVIQRFLDRCHKRHFTSQTVSIFNLLEQQDKSAFKRAINNHMLRAIIPKGKELVYNLRRRRCHLPQIKTERYKKTFVNRLIFKYNLV